MSIPPNPNYIDYDFSDPLCYPGSGTTVFDLSVNGYDANIVAGATFVSDGQKSYFQFNGGSDAITTGTNSTAGLSDFTLNVWCYPENDSGENIVLSIGNDGTGTIPFIDYSLFTSGKFLISNGFGAGTVEASILTPINNWYMVTYTKIGSDVKIYIDGVLAGSTTGTISISASTEFRLAAYATGVAPHFEGRIAIASIYGSGLTGSQVTDVYNATVLRFYPPPVPNYASFDFSDPLSYPGTGNTIYDLTPLGNDLTNTGLAGTFGGTGQSKYYSFVGGSDQFYKNNCSSDGFVAGKLYTASEFLWVRSSDWNVTGNFCLAGWGDDIGPGGGQLGIWKNLASAGPGLLGMMGSLVGGIKYPTNPTNDEWHHLGYVADGSGCTLYLDGTAVGSVPQTSIYPSGTGITGYVGIQIPIAPFMALGGLASAYYGTGGFDLAVAEFFNTSLDGIEVNSLYNSQASRFAAAPPVPLTSICSFDFSNPSCFNGTGTAVNDLSTSNNDFTLDNTNYTFTTTYGGEILIDQNNRFGRFTDLNNFNYGVNAYTVIMWMQQNSQGASDFNMFHILQETGGVGSNNTIYFGTKPGTAGNQLFVSDGSATSDTTYDFPLNTWKMVAFTKDTGAPYDDTHIYIDGVEITQTWTGSATINVGTGDPMFFANPSPAGGFWNFDVTIGQTDIYAEFLSSADILDYFNNTSARYSPPPPPTPSNVGGRQFAQGFNG